MKSEKSVKQAQSIVGTSKGRPDHDFYPTPAKYVFPILDVECFSNKIWECACGDGSMAEAIKKRGYQVIATDLFDRGYGTHGIDFLKTEKRNMSYDIITNPPFILAQEFAEHALSIGTKKVALLLKLSFLEGKKRSAWMKTSPLKSVYVFERRIKLGRNGIDYKQGGMIAFAWFVWERSYKGKPEIGWIDYED